MTECPARKHTYVSYCMGKCRCPVGREDYRIYAKRRREGRGPARKVPSCGYQRRVHAMQAVGWSYRHIRADSGIYDVNRIDATRYVLSATAAAIRGTYERLAWEDGPSIRSVYWAERNGWAPAWAWEGIDIDDPRAKPHTVVPIVDEVLVERVFTGAARFSVLSAQERRMAIQLAIDKGWSGQRIQHDFRISGTVFTELRKVVA